MMAFRSAPPALVLHAVATAPASAPGVLPLAYRMARGVRLLAALAVVAVLGACATAKPYDYSAFKESRPASLLVLPPLNESPDIKGSYGVLSHVTLPLAEAGYYVVPVSLMDETFRQNGLNHPAEIHDVSAQKLREIFGADAAVYIKIKQYGTRYAVLSSETSVVLEARIVDLRSGQQLWQGQASASSSENEGGNQGGLLGALIGAALKQVINTSNDSAYRYAGTASRRLLTPRPNGILYGPRSPSYQKEKD